MTVALSGEEIFNRIEATLPGSITRTLLDSIVVKHDVLFQVASFLRSTPGLDFNYLSYITAVDYGSYFEVVYYLVSLEHNHSLLMRVHCTDREHPSLPSVYSIWKGADFQEREIYDLMGISFIGHPNLKRIFLWDGFPGHPLRKDFKQ
jgi:NADH-quinone oxidoreductase subunit C